MSERAGGGEPAVRHPWEVARARHVHRLLARDLPGRTTLLDMGSGDGYVAQALRMAEPRLHVVSCDSNYSDVDLQEAQLGVVRVRTPPPDRFDVLLLLDVIEHVEQVEPFLRDLARNSARDDSVLLVTVPAHPRLFSDHDVALGHFRRYTAGELRAQLTASGWSVREAGAFYTLPLLARGAQMLRRRRSSALGQPENLAQWHRGPFTTRAVTAVLQADAAVNRGLARAGGPSIGLSLWALAVPVG